MRACGRCTDMTTPVCPSCGALGITFEAAGVDLGACRKCGPFQLPEALPAVSVKQDAPPPPPVPPTIVLPPWPPFPPPPTPPRVTWFLEFRRDGNGFVQTVTVTPVELPTP
jgi:hypothetical protein